MRPLDQRFHGHIMADPNSGCWLWTASLNTSGYGQISIPRRGVWKSHRASWLLYRGEIPPGMQVLHKCDVRSCCNPDHLFLGTNEDNVADKIAKGRGVCGTSHGRAKLSDDQVKEIRLLRGKRSVSQLSKDFGISGTSVRDAQSGRCWKHIN